MTCASKDYKRILFFDINSYPDPRGLTINFNTSIGTMPLVLAS